MMMMMMMMVLGIIWDHTGYYREITEKKKGNSYIILGCISVAVVVG